jgi:tetratricopeptide (TPR) repeat protein
LIVTPQPSLTFLKQLIKNNSEKVPFELIVVGKRKDFKEATFTKNLNDAIKIAKGDFIVFLAPSCFPLPGWLDEMLRVALKDRRVKLVGPKLINPRNSRIEHAGICYFKEKSILRATCIYKGLDAEDPLVNKKRRFQAVSTLCMLVRKGVLQGEINSLEDLCFKVHSQGGWIFYAPEASLYYDGPASIEIPVYRGAKADLKRILSRDGFLIHQDDGVYKILPSRRLIKRLRREKEFIRLYELLECAILGLNKDEKLSSFYNKEMERLLRDLLSWENKNILSLIELPIRGNPMRDAKARILFYRGVILGEGGGVDQGLVYLERALELCEHRILRVNILLHKWILLKKKGLLREAENSFCEAMAYEEYPANLTFGNYFRTQGRLKEAIKIYEDGLAKAKEENLRIRFLYAMASTLKDLGRYYESIRGFKKILRKKLPAHMFHMVGGAHFHLGDNFARLGRVCKARHHLERCLKYMPEHQKAKILLKNLSGS